MTDNPLLVVACALLALPAGWFVAVLVDRIPGAEPLWRPLLGWRPTRKRVAIHLVTLALYVAVGWRFEGEPVLVVIAALVWFTSLSALSIIDLEHQRLPDRLTGPTYLVLLPLIVVASLVEREPEAIRYAVLGGVLWVLFLGVGWLMGMGFGDVKAGGIMGLFVGWTASSLRDAISLSFWALLLACAVFIVFGVTVRIAKARRSGRTRERQWFAFGPFLMLGSGLAVLLGPQLVPGG